MTLNEAKKLLERKINETKTIIENAPNGDKLYIRTSITYMNSALGESADYSSGRSTAILANLIVRAAGKFDEEDHEFYYTIATNIKDEEILDPSKLEKEYLDFDSRVIEFLDKLKETEDAEALVAEECRLIEEEGRQLVAKFEASLKAMKKGGLIATFALLAIIVIIFTIKAFLGN